MNCIGSNGPWPAMAGGKAPRAELIIRLILILRQNQPYTAKLKPYG